MGESTAAQSSPPTPLEVPQAKEGAQLAGLARGFLSQPRDTAPHPRAVAAPALRTCQSRASSRRIAMPVLRLRLACACCLTLLTITAGDAEIGLEAAPGVSWFVQLSDLHLSEFEELAGNFRERDLASFGAAVLPGLRPSAVVISGDLADSRTRERRADQRAAEWEKYGRVLAVLRNSSSGVGGNVLDVRGNHDTFDVGARGGARDCYFEFSASGAAWKHSRVRITTLESPFAEEADGACPPALLVGVDTSQDPGLRAPTNFIGLAYENLLQELDFKLTKSTQQMATQGCQPLLIAYGHFTLSTIAYPERSLWVVPGQATERVEDVLMRHGVVAYLCGHLHEVFGSKLHRMHASPENHFLAELEMGDWKFARRFRVMAVDNGALSFADMRYKPHPGSQSGFDLECVSDSMRVGRHIVVITSPSSAHLSPLGSAMPASVPKVVHALVLPVDGSTEPGEAEDDNVEVVASWTCDGNAHSNRNAKMSRVDMDSLLYAVNWDPQSDCGSSDVHLQVSVSSGSAAQSRSEAIYVRTRQATSPKPQQHTMTERGALGLDWPVFARKIFFLLWGIHLFGMLLIPKMLMVQGVFLPPERLMQPMLDKKDLSDNGTCRIGSQDRQCCHFTNGYLGAKMDGSHSLVGHLVSPLRVLAFASLEKPFWQGQLVYSAYTLFGPLCLARVLSSQNLGFIYYYGVSAPYPGRDRFVYINMPDSMFVSIFHNAGSVLPCTMWLAWVIARWMATPRVVQTKWAFVTIPQAIVGVPVAWTHLRILQQLGNLYGPAAVLLSPVGWWGPFCLLQLYYSWRSIKESRAC